MVDSSRRKSMRRGCFLAKQDVLLTPQELQLTIKRSKTDQLGYRSIVTMPTHEACCPVLAMTSYFITPHGYQNWWQYCLYGGLTLGAPWGATAQYMEQLRQQPLLASRVQWPAPHNGSGNLGHVGLHPT